jgi:hypothetical protein
MCGLYALARVGNVEEFQRVQSVANLQRSQIKDVAMAIEWEKFCIPDLSTFVALLTDTATHTCVTPTLLRHAA